MPELRPKKLKRFPWATLGRLEMPGEFFQKIAEERNRESLLANQPKFSFICVVDNEDDLRFVAQTWESLQLQSYSQWEAWIVGRLDLKARLQIPIDERF